MHHHQHKPLPPKPLLPLGWTKRRARSLMRAFRMDRSEAAKEALLDFQDMHGIQRRRFS